MKVQKRTELQLQQKSNKRGNVEASTTMGEGECAFEGEGSYIQE